MMMTPRTKARPVSQIERITMGSEARTERLLLVTTIEPDAAALKMAVTGKRAWTKFQLLVRVPAARRQLLTVGGMFSKVTSSSRNAIMNGSTVQMRAKTTFM